MTTYKFNRNGVIEEVVPETWRWEAYFDDGSVLKQFDDESGVFHQIGEVDQYKLKTFKMVSPSFPWVYVIPFNPEKMRLIHKYIRTGLGVGTPEFREIKSYCFGYKTKGLPENSTHLLIIPPNGEIIMCEDPNIISFE